MVKGEVDQATAGSKAGDTPQEGPDDVPAAPALLSSLQTSGGGMIRGMTPGGKKGVTILEMHQTSGENFKPIHQPSADKPSTPGILRPSSHGSARFLAPEDDESEGPIEGSAPRSRPVLSDRGSSAQSTHHTTPSRIDTGLANSSSRAGSQASMGSSRTGTAKSGLSVGNLHTIHVGDLGMLDRLGRVMELEKVIVDSASGEVKLLASDLQALCDNLKDNHVVQSLTLGFCGIDDKGAGTISGALRVNTTLRTLNLWDNEIGTAGGEELGQALIANRALLEINLRSNALGPRGALGLAKGLFKNGHVAVIHMRYNDIGDQGAKALAATLMQNTTITEMDLARNRIGVDGAEAVMKALTHNTTLTHLNLQRNVISDMGGRAVGLSLKINTSLTHLDLQDCLVGDIGSVAIFESLGGVYYTMQQDPGAKQRRAKNMPAANTNIRFLNMGGNRIGEEGGIQAGRALHVNQGLTTLDLSNNLIGDQASEALAAALAVNTGLLELSLAGNSIRAAGGLHLGQGLSANSTLVAFEMQRNQVPWVFDTSGFTSNLTLRALTSDLNLIRVDVTTGPNKVVSGYKIDVSHARERSGTECPLDVFGPMSRALLSVHCQGNNIGLESLSEVEKTLAKFTATATALLDLSLARNMLRDDHLKPLIFTSLTLLDLSHNHIGNLGVDSVISALSKAAAGPKLKEIDVTDNRISKMPPLVAYMTTLESVYLEENPIMASVPLTAAQGGVRAITVWLHRWAWQQLHLTEKATNKNKDKEISSIKSVPDEVDTASGPPSVAAARYRRASAQIKPLTRLVIPGGGLSSLDTSGLSKTPSAAASVRLQADVEPQQRGFQSSAPRFPKSQADLTPGPIDYSPYDSSYRDTWRAVESKGEHKFEYGPKLRGDMPLTEEREAFVLEVRKQLIEESFNGMPVQPASWGSPRHPNIIDAVRKNAAMQKGGMTLFKSWTGDSAGHVEKYGIENVRREVNRIHPSWNVSHWQIIKVFKKHEILHADDTTAAKRPHHRASWGAIGGEGGVRRELPVKHRWESKLLFVEAVNAVFGSRKLEGFSQWLLLDVPTARHTKHVERAREQLAKYDWEDAEQRSKASILIRNLLAETYVYHYKSRQVFDLEALTKDVDKVLETGGLKKTPDEKSLRAEASRKTFDVFISDDWPGKIDEVTPSPQSYNTENHKGMGDGTHGVNMGRLPVHPPNWRPPSPGPSPQDYSPAVRKPNKGPIHWRPPVGKEHDPLDDSPGVCKYETPDIFSKHFQTSPGKTLYSRAWVEYQNSFAQGMLGPGPGAYELNKSTAPPSVPVHLNSTGRHSPRLGKSKMEIRHHELSTVTRPPSFSMMGKMPPPPSLDPTCPTRITPGPVYEAFYVKRNGRDVPIEEITSGKSTSAFSMSGTALKPVLSTTMQTPDPGTYNIPQLIGTEGPRWSLGLETTGRSRTDVTHVPVRGRQGPNIGTMVLKPQREQTTFARTHTGAARAIAKLNLDDLGPTAGGSSKAKSARGLKLNVALTNNKGSSKGSLTAR